MLQNIQYYNIFQLTREYETFLNVSMKRHRVILLFHTQPKPMEFSKRQNIKQLTYIRY